RFRPDLLLPGCRGGSPDRGPVGTGPVRGAGRAAGLGADPPGHHRAVRRLRRAHRVRLVVVRRGGVDRGGAGGRAPRRPAGRPVPGQPGVLHRERGDRAGAVRLRGGRPGAAPGATVTHLTAARRPWIVGVSGASGTPYPKAVIGALLGAGLPVDLIVSRAA